MKEVCLCNAFLEDSWIGFVESNTLFQVAGFTSECECLLDFLLNKIMEPLLDKLLTP